MEERREAVLQAAIGEFAQRGLHGASTEAIARRVGISQPYIFKIFGTKKDLFLAAVERVYDDTLAAFRVGLQQPDSNRLAAMGRAFEALVTSHDQLLMLLQGVAAVADPDVRALTERRFRELYTFVQEHSQASDFQVQQFLGYGLYLAFAISIDFQPPKGGTA